MRGRHFLVTALVLAALVSVAPGGGAPPAPPPPAAESSTATERVKPAARAKAALRKLVRDTRALPAKKNRRVKARLLRSSKAASRSYRRNPCNSVRQLKRYRTQVAKVKGRRAKTNVSWRSLLRADVFAADAAVKISPRTKRCGGASRPPAEDLTVSVLSSDINGIKLRVALPEAQFVAERGGGKDFTQLVMEGMGEAGSPGQPGVPSASQLFAVPPGSGIVAKYSNVSSYVLQGVNLFPQQNQPEDQTPGPGQPPKPSAFDLDTPFVQEADAYKSAAPFPQKPAAAAPQGTLRDLQLGGVDIAGAQYQPRQRRLRVFTRMDVELQFVGQNPGYFADSRVGDPFNIVFNRLYEATVLNWAAIRAHLDRREFRYCGRELLIVTSPDLRPAADTLAASRSAAGYVTGVFEVGAGPGQIGTTNEQIQAFIRSQLNGSCLVRPSYLILLGNTAHVPTFLVPCGPGGDPNECNIASDLPYALDGIGTDYLADIAYGRIPAPDLTVANDLVNKIITYETSPPAPSGDPFYRSSTVTGYFEPTFKCVLNAGETGTPNCDGAAPPVTGHWELDTAVTRDARGFTKTAETVRNGMLAHLGHSAERIYVADPALNPLEYHDGTPMPAAIRRPTFAWDGDTTDFLNAFNDGRTVVLHRDHGWPAGWADPTLHEGHLPLLTNGTELPVVFGINCASAQYDIPADPSFIEGLLQKVGGGAVGAFGDSRNSGTWSNNRIALGFLDAIFPAVVPTYGSATGLRRMGDVLLAGKQYFQSVDGAYTHHFLYGYFGDPTMQLWIAEPLVFDVDKFLYELVWNPLPEGPQFWIKVKVNRLDLEGTITTLRYRDEVVGRALIQNGEALIPALGDADNDALDVSFEQDGYIPAVKELSPNIG